MLNKDSLLKYKKQRILTNYQTREALNQLLMVHPDKRSAEQEEKLASLLLEFPCMQYIAEDNYQKFQLLTREVHMMCLIADTEVIKQGEQPDCAYIMI